MKHVLLTAALVAACASASAQSLHTLSTSVDPTMMALGISANGKYVTGSTYDGYMFVADWEAGKIQFAENKDELGAQGRAVSDEGVAYGFNVNAFSLNIEGDTATIWGQNSMADGVTRDGAVVVGNLDTDGDYETNACYWKDGQFYRLPEPTESWVGFEISGTAAKYVSDNASTIVGYYIDNFSTYPAIAWHLNAGDSTYSVVPFCKRWYDGSYDLNTGHPYQMFTPSGVSSDGKWVAMTVQTIDSWFPVMARYNIEEDSLEVISAPSDDYDEQTIYATGIANDGTLIGFVENDNYDRVALYCKAGETTFQKLSDAFPTVEGLQTYDNNGWCVPTGITPNGKYIVGYSSVQINGASDDEGGFGYETFILDTDSDNGLDGINNVNGDEAKAKTVATYSTDGRRVNANQYHGLVITKTANGKASKSVKR